MINFKQEIANKIAKVVDMNEQEIYGYIEVPKDTKNGDFAFPCFNLAKTLRKAPPMIANEIKEKLELDDNIIEKVEVIGGYLNFYINQNELAKGILEKVSNENVKLTIGEGKTVVIDYSAPNIAKPFHIGHLKTTVIGGALYNIYKYLGYKVVGINYLGDYGTQFGKLIEGYKRWGSDYDLTDDPIDKLADIYKRINALAEDDEEVLNICRDNFRLLENGDEYCTKLWNEFKDLSLQEFQKIYDLLGSHFDSWDGEAAMAKKERIDEVMELLEKSGRLTESEGAQIVDLTEQGINTPCIVRKSDGSTIYAIRDLAAILYRSRTYDYDKSLYVTSYEQNLHFKQVFEVAKLLGIDEKYTNGLEHVPYGMVRLPSGKMSTRKGNFVKIKDLLNDTIAEAKKIIEEKNPDLDDKDEVAKRVGVGAVIFNNLATNRVKDEVFDINEMLNFQGETGPYVQYTYVRTKSVLRKVDKVPTFDEIDVEKLNDEYSKNIIKLLYNFEDMLVQVTEKEVLQIIKIRMMTNHHIYIIIFIIMMLV
ncbi:MAG: arginine--tRNA ligase [Clostridia bacterium]|nr:arginine--tRNA ligase [Clostridia bacterium]